MKLFRVAIALALISGVAYTGRLIWNSDALRLKKIEVAGNRHVTKEEVAAATELTPGMHLLRLSPRAVAAKIGEIAWIRDARVERIIPSKVRITVIERVPSARVSLDAAGYLVDQEGVVLEEGADAPIVVAGLPIQSLRPGDRITLPQYRQALAIARGLKGSLRDKLIRIKAPTLDGITLEFADGVSVLYGVAEQMEEKNFAITSLLDQALAEGTKIATIDVRVPRRPAVRPR